jgi:hypothetical protein
MQSITTASMMKSISKPVLCRLTLSSHLDVLLTTSNYSYNRNMEKKIRYDIQTLDWMILPWIGLANFITAIPDGLTTTPNTTEIQHYQFAFEQGFN